MARDHFVHWPYAPGFISQVWETALDITAGQFDLLPSDIQQQVLGQVISQKKEMEYWNQMHGLPNLPPLHQNNNNRTTTPPMPLPLVDSHHPTFDHSMGTSYSEDEFNMASNWTSGWESNFQDWSPFRQEIHYGLPMIGTVSPDQLHPPSHQAMMSSNDDVGFYTFSDSDGSLPDCHFQQLPAFPVSSVRRSKNTIPGQGTYDTSSHAAGDFIYGAPFDGQQGLYDHQQRENQQSRHPLPPGRFRTAQQGGRVRSSGRRLDGGAAVQESPSVQPILRGNALLTSSNQSTTTMTSRAPRRPDASAGRHHAASTAASPQPGGLPVHIATAGPSSSFPPGADQPGFVPIGEDRVASRAQGNVWPVARDLMERIVAAERNVDGRRSRDTQLTYKQIKAKYSRWKISESTLRGIKRVYDLPREHRERIPTWNDEHIQALRRAVPCCTDFKGHIAWGQIVELIKRDTGKPFGATTVRKKWQELVSNGLHQQNQSQSGREEGDNEDVEDDSSEALDAFNVSDEERF